jgi:hypothetical protein
MESGQIVTVTDAWGHPLTRRVIVDRGSSVVVCNEEEFGAAKMENRAPQGIAFPMKDVIRAT